MLEEQEKHPQKSCQRFEAKLPNPLCYSSIEYSLNAPSNEMALERKSLDTHSREN